MFCGRWRATVSTTTGTSRRAMSAPSGKHTTSSLEENQLRLESSFIFAFGDIMGPITPSALGGFTYASTFVDQETK